jgi:hypothetical protein
MISAQLGGRAQAWKLTFNSAAGRYDICISGGAGDLTIDRRG